MRPPEAVILDLVLPDGSGTDVCRELRTWSRRPVIVLSAVGEEREKVAALDAGADDYVTKPFGVDELLARLRAALRRVGAVGRAGDRRSATSHRPREAGGHRRRQAGAADPARVRPAARPRPERGQAAHPPHDPARGVGPGLPGRVALPPRLRLAAPSQDRARSRPARATCSPSPAPATGSSTRPTPSGRLRSFRNPSGRTPRTFRRRLTARRLPSRRQPRLALSLARGSARSHVSTAAASAAPVGGARAGGCASVADEQLLRGATSPDSVAAARRGARAELTSDARTACLARSLARQSSSSTGRRLAGRVSAQPGRGVRPARAELCRRARGAARRPRQAGHAARRRCSSGRSSPTADEPAASLAARASTS